MSHTIDYGIKPIFHHLTQDARWNVLSVLILHSNVRNRCWPTMDTVMNMATNGNRNIATRAKKWLIEHKAIELVPFDKRMTHQDPKQDETKLAGSRHVYQLTGVIEIEGQQHRYLYTGGNSTTDILMPDIHTPDIHMPEQPQSTSIDKAIPSPKDNPSINMGDGDGSSSKEGKSEDDGAATRRRMLTREGVAGPVLDRMIAAWTTDETAAYIKEAEDKSNKPAWLNWKLGQTQSAAPAGAGDPPPPAPSPSPQRGEGPGEGSHPDTRKHPLFAVATGTQLTADDAEGQRIQAELKQQARQRRLDAIRAEKGITAPDTTDRAASEDLRIAISNDLNAHKLIRQEDAFILLGHKMDGETRQMHIRVSPGALFQIERSITVKSKLKTLAEQGIAIDWQTYTLDLDAPRIESPPPKTFPTAQPPTPPAPPIIAPDFKPGKLDTASGE